jgi:hypothetical protein
MAESIIQPKDLGSNLGKDKNIFLFCFFAVEFKSVGCKLLSIICKYI